MSEGPGGKQCLTVLTATRVMFGVRIPQFGVDSMISVAFSVKINTMML